MAIQKMKVMLRVEFEVFRDEGDDYDWEITPNIAKSAASLAAWENLALTNNGMDVVESVTVHVDGYGECRVRVGEDHE